MDYIYVLVRADLPSNQQAVQACHAGLSLTKYDVVVKDNSHLVILTINNEPTLQFWYKKLFGIAHLTVSAFCEPYFNNSMTAIAIAGVRATDRTLFKDLQLSKFNEVINMVYEGKWGFYPCDYSTFKKLKQLNKLSYLALRAFAMERRWLNKLPHNRVRYVGQVPKQRVRKRDRQYVAVPQPTVPDISAEQIKYLIEQYAIARYPKPRDEVVMLSIKDSDIDRYLFIFEKWLSSNAIIPDIKQQ